MAVVKPVKAPARTDGALNAEAVEIEKDVNSRKTEINYDDVVDDWNLNYNLGSALRCIYEGEYYEAIRYLERELNIY